MSDGHGGDRGTRDGGREVEGRTRPYEPDDRFRMEISPATPASRPLTPQTPSPKPHTEPHLSFNVESATNPRTMVTIHARTITFGSGHPFSSKW